MKNYSIYGLPEKVIFCKKCTISNQRPSSVVEFKNITGKQKKGINIGKDGICDSCKYNDTKGKIDWKKREQLLRNFLKKFRKNNGEYDCIVPSSGGKDSSFTAHVLKNKYKMNPLAVTWAPNMWTSIGKKNFENLSKIGGIDSLLYTPNGVVHRYLTQQAFLNLGHPFQPFIHGQKIIGPKIAAKYNIKLIIYGENQAEYGNNIKDNKSYLMNNNFFSIDSEKDIERLSIGGLKIKEILKKKKFKLNDLTSYLPLKKSTIEKKKLQMIYLGFFEKWDPQECFYYSCDNTGFRPADERSEGTYSKYTEIDDKIVPMHFYTTFIKFGIGRATYDSAQEIRNKKITREEGVRLVRKFDGEFPSNYFDEFLEYIDISKSNFFEVIDGLRSPHLWKREKKNWILKYQVQNF
jgi:N-acetyl sugar amidotransferase